MSEGELKKRIWSIVPKANSLLGYPPIRNLYEQEIAKILNEMQQEFPNFDDFYKKEQEDWKKNASVLRPNPYIIEHNAIINYIGELLKWQKKWHGE